MPSECRIIADPIFECRMCGDCCRGFGGTYVTQADMAAIARYAGVSPDRFRHTHCQPSGRRWVLAQAEDGYCVFHRNGRCAIHPVKPRMCRQWPFIPSVLADPSNWHLMAGSCPGMRTDISDDAIRLAVREELSGADS